MKPDYAVPVRYVLYTHYPENYDWQEHKSLKTPIDQLDGVRFLIRHLSGLQGLLTWAGYEGLLVLFYSPGLNECLEAIAKNKAEELKTCEPLQFAKAVNDYIEGVMKTQYKELLPRLRFFTALDLYQVFGRIKSSAIADRLPTSMVGDTALTYDSPKIIEAIVRLRLLGSGVPVFRVDYDVLLRGEENQHKKNLEFSSTVGSCLTAYELRRDSPNLASFIFSASYDHKILNEPDASQDFHKWGGAYATRVFPALPFDQNLIAKTIKTIDDCCEKVQQAGGDTRESPAKMEREIRAEEWDRYAAEVFNPRLARKFFGFDADRFVISESGGIGAIGAHPMASVISGAMLYLSDGAILDLPPFSNFRRNVSWVDDHLKYCLHRELKHLKRPTPENSVVRESRKNDLLTYSKIDDVVVQKAGRKIDRDLRKYIFDGYLPTLLRGTILDAWITPDPVLKYRPKELTKENRERQNVLLTDRQSVGLLPSALQDAQAACKFPKATKRDLENKLRASALTRITQVRRQWAALIEDRVETFASIWANGLAYERCKGLDLDYRGIVTDPKFPVHNELAARYLTHEVNNDLEFLVEDACDYIDWTRAWPGIVQVVRSVEQGTLKTDLNYAVETQTPSE